MTTTLSKNSDKQVARPLNVIAAEIKDEYKRGKTEATDVWRPHEERIGLLLIEAKTHFPSGGFEDWFNRQGFEFSYRTSQEYRKFASELGTLPDFVRREIFAPRATPVRMSHVTRPGYKPPVPELKQIRDQAAARAAQILKGRAKRAKEQVVIKRLAVQIIEAGFKLLSTRLHPDKGGSDEGMRRLIAARGQLKHALNFMSSSN
jgi:hypothetical protein